MKTFNRITIEHLYDEIEFAATKAAPLFSLYGWTWGLKDGTVGVPTYNEIVDVITRLAEHALEGFYSSDKEYRDAEVGSGRFSVRVHEFENEVEVKIVLELGEHSWHKA